MPRSGWLIVLAALALMPLGEGAFNLAMAVMAVLGLVMLIQHRPLRHDHRVMLMALLFLCIWLPMLLSLTGALEVRRAATTVAAFLRFPLAGVFIIAAVRTSEARRRLALGVAIVILAWCLDGLLQWILGRNIVGYPYDGENLTGLFHPRRVIGLIVAAVFPICLEVVRQLSRTTPLAWLLLLPGPLVVLLGGSRTSWLMLALGAALWGGFWYVRSSWRGRHWLAGAVVMLVLLSIPMLRHVPGLETRFEQTAKLFQADYDAINEATTLRLPIWEIALDVGRDHWLTGVGPRGFRYIYPDYADEDTPWVSPDGEVGASHPHQTVLEVFAETGVVGLTGFAAFWVIFAATLRRYGSLDAMPWAVGSIVAFFPLNVHMALYGTYWSHLSWWLLLVMMGTLASTRRSP